jgi:5-dehydro-2-deoxygluconokinase
VALGRAALQDVAGAGTGWVGTGSSSGRAAAATYDVNDYVPEEASIVTHLGGVNATGGQPIALVMGRVGADLYPQQHRTRLEDVRTFERFVGGFAGNVSTGLARLAVPTAILSAVGDDGHGRYVRRWLSDEGVDVRWLSTHPSLRTALAFCEVWPPDHFPITFYRTPTCPDWELRSSELPMGAIQAARLFYATGTGLARQPSRDATLAALAGRKRPSVDGSLTILDLDWREILWDEPDRYPALIHDAARLADVLVGGASEFEAARIEPSSALRLGPRGVVVKHGPEGATVLSAEGETHVAGLPVPVANGLGAGDAFAAALGAGLLAGLSPADAVARGNAAGAIVATRLACSAAMPDSAEIDALLAGGRVVDGAVVPA